MLKRWFWLALPGLALLYSCHNQPATPPANSPTEPGKMTITLKSTAFAAGAFIPKQATCDGPDISPPLKWSGVPAKAVSQVLICEDPDAPSGTWTHWVVFNLPGQVSELGAGVPPAKTLANSAAQGTNDFKKIGYGGPCPPQGQPHRYLFKIYALDTKLKLAPGATKQQVLDAMNGHTVAEGQLTGTYRR